jgi:hypothetical protein
MMVDVLLKHNEKKSIKKSRLAQKSHIDNVEMIHHRIKEKLLKGNPLTVVFIVQFPEMWNSTKSIYDFMLEDPRFDPYIIAVPKRGKSNILHTQFLKDNEASDFFSKNGIDVHPVNIKNCKVVLEDISPDYIFLQRTYDSHMPKPYSQYILSEKSLLCYVPYGYEFVNGFHLDVEYNRAAMDCLYMIFSENSETYEYCKNRSKYYIEGNGRKIYDVGYPRFDLLKNIESKDNGKITFLWLPRWSVGKDGNDRSHFCDYYDLLMKYFNENKDRKLIIRPHPLMFSNFVQLGVLSEEQVNEIKENVAKSDNVEFDNNSDYIESFKEADILISDFTALLIEFFVLNKPIIYCGEIEQFNSVGMKMAEGIYMASSWDSVKSRMEMLAQGKDEKKCIHQCISEKICNSTNNIGAKISEVIYDDAKTYV